MPTEGPPGTTVTVSGTGFGSNEPVDIDFQAMEVGNATTSGEGAFSATITIPDMHMRNQQFVIHAVGKQSIRSDTAPFKVK